MALFVVSLYVHIHLFSILNDNSLFERAIQTIGDDYLAQTLWDKYIEFELSQEEYVNVFSLYTRLVYVPLKALPQYWEQCKNFINSKLPTQILSPEEYAYYASIGDVEQQRKEIIATREKLYEETYAELTRRNIFEQGIERPYFHVQPLGTNELNAWRQYLENDEEKCDENRVIKLYERCLVACVSICSCSFVCICFY